MVQECVIVVGAELCRMDPCSKKKQNKKCLNLTTSTTSTWFKRSIKYIRSDVQNQLWILTCSQSVKATHHVCSIWAKVANSLKGFVENPMCELSLLCIAWSCVCLLRAVWCCTHSLHHGRLCVWMLLPACYPPSNGASFHPGQHQIQTHSPTSNRADSL